MSEDDRLWQAVLARDRRFDERFVYAVRSTGIYCRPSCPSRRPKRAVVEFFAGPSAAERAGFRSCRRCRPQEPVGDPGLARVRGICRHIEENLDGPLTLAHLGRQAGLSPHHLQRTFKAIMGISPRQYADGCRLAALKASLQKGDPVAHATFDAGYGSSSRLYERAAKQLGMTPAVYRRGGRGMQLAYAIRDSPLGRLLVAASGRGVSAVSLGDSDARLESALRKEYPRAELHRDDAGLGESVGVVLKGLQGRPHPELPLDIRATAFQRRVWQELCRIPRGETRSYGEIARLVGRPKGARAVARACATNPVSVLIPCHRVVPAGGGVGGYRWGHERKMALLEAEGVPTSERSKKM